MYESFIVNLIRIWTKRSVDGRRLVDPGRNRGLSVGQILSVKRINPWTETCFPPDLFGRAPAYKLPRRSFLVIFLHHFVQLILLCFRIMGGFARFTTPSTRGRGNKKQRNDLWLRLLRFPISCAT